MFIGYVYGHVFDFKGAAQIFQGLSVDVKACQFWHCSILSMRLYSLHIQKPAFQGNSLYSDRIDHSYMLGIIAMKWRKKDYKQNNNWGNDNLTFSLQGDTSLIMWAVWFPVPMLKLIAGPNIHVYLLSLNFSFIGQASLFPSIEEIMLNKIGNLCIKDVIHFALY